MMTMKKPNEANKISKAKSAAKMTTNLTAMVATYLVVGGSRGGPSKSTIVDFCSCRSC